MATHSVQLICDDDVVKMNSIVPHLLLHGSDGWVVGCFVSNGTSGAIIGGKLTVKVSDTS